MIAVLIISLLASLINCANSSCHLNETEVLKLQKYLNNSVLDHRNDINAKYDFAICLGMTKCGKSTLINYLMENNLTTHRASRFDNYASIIKAKNDSKGPVIGTQSTSQTADVSKWALTKIPNMYMWDTPGLADNRGEVQDIKNAFSISGLVKSFKSVKFVFVLDYDNIVTDNTASLTNFLQYVQDIFGQSFLNTFRSMAVIISKAPFQVGEAMVDYEFINYHLNRFISSNISMNLNSKIFINYTIHHSNQVAFFRRLTDKSQIGDIDFNIVNAINNSNFTRYNSFTNMQPSISPNTKSCLHGMRSKLKSLSLISNLEKFLLDYLHEVAENMKALNMNATNENDDLPFGKQLGRIRLIINKAMNPMSSFDEKIKIIEDIDHRIKEMIINLNLDQNLKFMTFFDKLLGLPETKEYEITFNAIMITLSHHIDVQTDNNLKELMLNDALKHQKEMLEMEKQFKRNMSIIQEQLENLKKQYQPGNIFLDIFNSLFKP